MNKRKLKKSLKKTRGEALVNQNAYLKRENAKLRQSFSEVIAGVEEIKKSFNANLAAIARSYGEKEDSVMVLRVPIAEVTRAIMDYDVKCAVESGDYVIKAWPKVDDRAE